MLYEESFGVIPLKKQNDIWMTYLVKNKSGNHWGFPKGHANISETQKDAAIRELKEETNLNVISFITEKPFIEQYSCIKNSQKVAKKVYYYLVEVEGEAKVITNEILEDRWIELYKAKDLITYDQSKAIAKQVEIFLENL